MACSFPCLGCKVSTKMLLEGGKGLRSGSAPHVTLRVPRSESTIRAQSVCPMVSKSQVAVLDTLGYL
jgi:hypothetical protein